TDSLSLDLIMFNVNLTQHSEQRDKVQRSSQDQIGRKRIELQVGFPGVDSKSYLVEYTVPLRDRPVVVREGDTVASISHPIHDPQSQVIQAPFGKVILDDNGMARG